MSRTITAAVTTTNRGMTVHVGFVLDGIIVKQKRSTRLWGQQTPKSPDDLLCQQVAGALNVLLREWMDQAELPF
uniref:Uncharacterized protein n=1 Tax=uncultured prokaryote TaxID=198431 RepID=A0A0H5Q7D5_9ZZZZ|nr:hypothetical protein [uncultured prokaryote]